MLNHSGQVHRYNTAWLRDHCRGEGSYLKDSSQRARDILQVGLGVKVTRVELSGGKELVLELEWKDGERSTFGLDWLDDNYNYRKEEEDIVPVRLWDKEVKSEILENCSVDWSNLMKSNDELCKLIRSILRYG